MADNYYDILGVKKDAPLDQIKKAYRKLAQKHHPDRTKGDKASEEKFKKINEAYETLSDPQKRSNYDQFGSAGANFGRGYNYGGGADFGQGFDGRGFDFSSFSDSFGGSGFSDIFETFFGVGGKKSRAKRQETRGNDIELDLKISFEESVFGAEKEISVNVLEICSHCKGSGAEPGSPIITCDVCGGSGQISEIRNTILGQIKTVRTCNECGGLGKKPKEKCSICHGTLRVKKTKNINVSIPAGIDDGSTIRIRGMGDDGILGGETGDLYVNIFVKSSKKFIRDGFDIHTEEKIDLIRAVLGDKVEIETVYGSITLKIPAGTQSGQVFKLNEKGIKKIKSEEKGDHFVKIIVEIPTKLNKKEKELYLEIAKEKGIDLNSSKDGFFNFF